MKIQEFIFIAAFGVGTARGFAVPTATVHSSLKSRDSTKLKAIGVLARKAKEADIRKYCEEGVPDNVMEKYQLIKAAQEQPTNDVHMSEKPLQQVLTRRRGTVSLIAEYKRRVEKGGFIDEIFDPEILSPTFREAGASGIAVMADNRMGGCTYDDVAEFVEEQHRHRMDVPGSVMVISNDLVVDEVQIAQAAAVGAAAVVLCLNVVGDDQTRNLMLASKAVGMECIVSVESAEEARRAVELGASIIRVDGVEDVDEKTACIADLPEDVCTIASILAKDNKQLEEIEEAWMCRDKGFNCVWVCDALYKSGNDAVESPSAIIKSMLAKSSVKWASPKARSGRGEGAREYLGDILM